MTELSQVAAPFRVRYIIVPTNRDAYRKKTKAALAKFNSARENFEKREKRIKADLEEASKTWAELSERFRWWQSLP